MKILERQPSEKARSYAIRVLLYGQSIALKCSREADVRNG